MIAGPFASRTKQKLQIFGAPITYLNGRLLARTKNDDFPCPDKPLVKIPGAGGAFLRLKRWASVEHPSGMKDRCISSAVIPLLHFPDEFVLHTSLIRNDDTQKNKGNLWA
jgi:hypothetical protein